MCEPELVLGIVGSRIRRIEGEKLLELVDGEHERFARPLAEIRIADPQLRIGPIRTLRVGFDDLLEEFAGRQPFLVVERGGSAFEEEFVGLAGAGRHHVSVVRRARQRAHQRGESGKPEDERRQGAKSAHNVSVNH